MFETCLCIMNAKINILQLVTRLFWIWECSKRGLVFRRISLLILPSSYSRVGLRTLTWGQALARSSACLMHSSSHSHPPHHPYQTLIPRQQRLVMVPWLNFLDVQEGSLPFFANSLLPRGPGTHNEQIKFWIFSFCSNPRIGMWHCVLCPKWIVGWITRCDDY